jgi:acyl-CoA synthetase (AMP-forming)/AMP-acid ligase II
VSKPKSVLDDPKSAATFPQLVRAAAAAYGDDIAVLLQDEGVPEDSISFAELDRRSAELARGLVARGVGKGSRVGFIYGNGPMFALLLAAIARIGAIAIPFSTLIKSNELVRVLRQSDVSGVIVQRSLLGHDYVERLGDALAELREGDSPNLRIADTPYLRWIASTGENLPPTIHDMSWLTNAADQVSEELLRAIENEVHPADQMIEIYTSGSMALPKGVKHNHGPAMFRAHWLREMIGPQRGQQVTAILPMFWVGGLMMYLLPNWEVGATTVCTVRTLNNSRIAMGSVLAEDDMKLMAAAKPYWGLGMSETLGPYSWGDELRSPGFLMCAPMDHFGERYDVRIADEEGNQVGDGEVGEVQVRGYPVTPGLHKIEREDYFTPDGFYHTGDMGLMQGKRVQFVGRNGDMIKTMGSNVSPGEVEMELQALEGVHSAYVVGVPDKERGQLVAAAIIPRDGAVLDFAEIEATLRKRMSGYKVPRAYVEITRDEVPMLHSNKVSRRMFVDVVARKLGREAGQGPAPGSVEPAPNAQPTETTPPV